MIPAASQKPADFKESAASKLALDLLETRSQPVKHYVHKLNIKEVIAYSIACFGGSLITRGVGDTIRPLFNTGFGLDSIWVGWAFSMPFFICSFFDPFLGYLSDNTHTRWGRRKPFILSGAIALALVGVGMWWTNTNWSGDTKLVYLVITCVLFGLSNSLFNLPLNALGFELTDDYHERSKIGAVLVFFTVSASMLSSWIYWLVLRPFWGGEINGIRWISCGLGAIILICALFPLYFCRERFKNVNRESISFLDSLQTTLQNRIFRHLVYIKLLMVLGTSIFGGMLFYINTYYICGGDKSKAMFITGIGGTLYTIIAIAQLPFVSSISRNLGKTTGLKIGLGIVLATTLLQPFVQNPDYPYLQMVTTVLCAPGFTLALIFMGAFMPDVCDIDEIKTGRRREGTFGAVSGFIDKIEWGVVSLMVGYLVSFAGFNQLLDHQSDETMQKIRYFSYAPNFLFTLAAFILACRFPITEEMMNNVRQTLDSRRKINEGTPN